MVRGRCEGGREEEGGGGHESGRGTGIDNGEAAVLSASTELEVGSALGYGQGCRPS